MSESRRRDKPRTTAAAAALCRFNGPAISAVRGFSGAYARVRWHLMPNGWLVMSAGAMFNLQVNVLRGRCIGRSIFWNF